MPTGVALRDPRDQLFAAAERILLRNGPSGLTSRAVTAEAGVAKGVLHRHFADFDDFLAALIRHRIQGLIGRGGRLLDAAGTGTVVVNLARFLVEVFDAFALAVVGLVISRDHLRAALRATTPNGIPLLAEAGAAASAYLSAERDRGRIAHATDTDALAFMLIGAGHLLFAEDPRAAPSLDAVEEVVGSVVVGAEPGRPADVDGSARRPRADRQDL